MKQHLSTFPVLAILALFIQTSGFAQDSNQDRDEDSPRKYDEIVIRHKGGKDAKVTIELKDGDVLVNGKPVTEYEDSTLTIHRRKVLRDGNTFTFSPDMAPFAMGHNFSNGSGDYWGFGNRNFSRSGHAMLGVVTERSPNGKGAKITQLPNKGSAAVKMGLQLGDIITKVDDEEINDHHALADVIGGHEAGDKVTITFIRDGKEQKVTGELGKAKEYTMEPMNLYKFEMPEIPELNALPRSSWPKEFRELYGNSMKFGIRAQDAEDGKGVKVLEVDDESTAAKAGIKEGDVITRFDGKEINSVTALTEAAHVAKEKISVKVTIVRDGKAQEIEVHVPRRLRTADL